MKKISFEVEGRAELGKGAVKKLRREGYIPGVIYGIHEAQNIKINTSNLLRLSKDLFADNVLINLSFKDDSKLKKSVIVQDVQKNRLKGGFVHIDFNEIDMNKKLHTSIHVKLIGEAKGVKLGGILDFTQREISIDCLPSDIPEKIEIDVENLNIGDSFHVRDLNLGDKVRIINNDDVTIVAVSAPRKEEVLPEGEEAKAAEPEVITKGKKDKEEAAATK